ncbi:MAG: sialate O-acetylesterase, partial [Verrucomicrobiota bacterium]
MTTFFFVLLIGINKAATYDLVIHCGQSQLRGEACCFTPESADTNILYYMGRADGPPGMYHSSGGDWTTLGPTPNGYWGPEVSSSRQRHAAGENVAVFKYSQGGTSLNVDWNSRTGGFMWNNMTASLIDAVTDLEGMGHDINLRAFFWVQGGSDANQSAAANAYAGNLSN